MNVGILWFKPKTMEMKAIAQAFAKEFKVRARVDLIDMNLEAVKSSLFMIIL